VNESEAEASLESIMEISFYGLLALINLSQNNEKCQEMLGQMGVIETITK